MTLSMIDRARALGIANHVVPDYELMARGIAYCARLRRGPSRAHANAESLALRQFLALAATTMTDSTRTADFGEGSRAWVERRPPDYRGE